MSEMKELRERLRELELRMSEVSGKLDSILNVTTDLQDKHNQLEKRREREERSRKESEWLLFKVAIIFGSLSGVLTGLVVLYLTKVYDILSIPSVVWLPSLITIALGYSVFLGVIWRMKRPHEL